MLGLIAPAFIALFAALALGGSPRNLVNNSIRGWPAVVACFALELVLYNAPVDRQSWAMHVGPWVWFGTRLVFLGVLIANARELRGYAFAWPWWVAACGVALNTLVIAANGGHMPQSPDAAMAIWGSSHIDPTRLQNVTLLSTDTRLPWLADIFAEPSWLPRRNVVSVGDIMLALGMAAWIFSTARSRYVTLSARGLRKR